MTSKIKKYSIAAATLILISVSSAAYADSLSVTYFTADQNGSDPDFYNNFGSSTPDGTFTGTTNGSNAEVTSSLGTNGLPVLNSSFQYFTDVHDLSSHQITWWSPSLNSNVTQTGSGTVTLSQSGSTFSYNNPAFYPNGNNDGGRTGFETAIFSGVLTVSQAPVIFNVSADDDVFIYINGVLELAEGGIHSASSDQVTLNLAAGNYSFEMFYADQCVTGASLDFSETGGTLNAVPEPATMVLFGAGLVGLAGLARRKQA